MRKPLRRLLVSLAVLAALGLAAPAGAAPSGLGLGVHGGYGESGDADSGSPLLGAHIELRPGAMLGLFGSISYKLDEDFSVTPAGAEAVEYQAYSVPVSAMARLYLPMKAFTPYGTVGAQWRYIGYDFGDIEESLGNLEADDSDSAFGWLVGGGAEFARSDRLAMFTEVRFEFIDADRDLGNADLETAEDFDYDQWSVMVGFTLYFGGE
jgi:opacity protein-like surface antigen